MKKFMFFTLLTITSALNCSGFGYNLGNSYYYNDNSGCMYSVNKLGNMTYVNGSNGYSGFGYQLGNMYFWND